MRMNFIRKLPIPQDIKALYPVDEKSALIRDEREEEIKKIFEGKSDKFILVIGPCSADYSEAVLDYIENNLKTNK